MSRASKLASARGKAHQARHSTNVAREKLQRVTDERDRLSAEVTRLKRELAQSKEALKDFGKVIHNMTVGQQAAWIEWKHGKGAEAGMAWIQNALFGPGFIPDEDEPYGKEAQAFFDANCSDPLPFCACGRPSNILWMGQGFCCEEHYNQARKASGEDA